jgi:hypothetical protein
MESLNKTKFDKLSNMSISTTDDILLKDSANMIIFKSINNETCNIYINLQDKILNSINFILESLKTTSEAHDLKLIYSGKILNFSNTFSFYGIKEDHVILYMLKEKTNVRGSDNEQTINNNLNNINQSSSSDDNNSFTQRGFGQLANFGASLREIQSMRLLFHANYMINRGITNYDDRSFWTRDAVVQREEEWMQQQNNNNVEVSESNPQHLSTQLRNMLIARRVRIAGENNSIIEVSQDQEVGINGDEKCWMFFIGFIMGYILGILVLFIVFIVFIVFFVSNILH